MGPGYNARAEAVIEDARQRLDEDLLYLAPVEDLLRQAQAALKNLKPSACCHARVQRVVPDLEHAVDEAVGWFDDMRQFRDDMSLVDAEAA